MVTVFSKDHGNVNFTEANHSWVSRKLSINLDDDVSLFLLYHHLQLNKGSAILLLLENREREREGRCGKIGGGREGWERRKEKKFKRGKRERGRERRERKGEQLYSKCHNKEAKRYCQIFFFFSGREQSRLSQAEYEHILCYMIPVCQECH